MKHIELRIAGIGGQGVVTAADLIGRAALDQGMHVSGSSRYGSAARGTPVRADLVLSDAPIDDPHVHEPGWLIAMSQEAYDAYKDTVEPGGTIVFDSDLVAIDESLAVTQLGVPALKTALHDVGKRQSANLVILGTFLAHSNLLTLERIEQAVHEHVPERFRDMNIQALRLGFAAARTGSGQ